MLELTEGTAVDRYTIEGKLGQGGMAIVYRARHNQLGTLHAIKVLLIPAQSIRERLLQEGRVQATLQHPNIVSVTDVIDVDGAPGLVMEYIEGVALDELLGRVKLNFEQADELARGILSGVEHAHRRGLIHRDLKPANVMLQTTPGGITPKVTDFGLAKVLQVEGAEVGSMTRSGMTMGTPCYMAPEQIRDTKSVDQRADIFSLGCILYELLTGRRAFDGSDILTIYMAVAEVDYVPVQQLVPEVPDRMRRAIERALCAEPDERVQSCAELLAVWSGKEHAPTNSIQVPSGPWDAELLRQVTPLATSKEPAPRDPSSDTWQPEIDGADTLDDDELDRLGSLDRPPSQDAPLAARHTQPHPSSSRNEAPTVSLPPAVPPPSPVAPAARSWLGPALLGLGLLGVLGVLGLGVVTIAGSSLLSSLWAVDTPQASAPPVERPVQLPAAEITEAPSVSSASPEAPATRSSVASPVVKPPSAPSPKVARAPADASRPTPAPPNTPAKPSTSTAVVDTPGKPLASEPSATPVLLRVRSVPWSQVKLDGVDAGRTGLWKRQVKPGHHQVTLTTADGTTITRTVQVGPDGASFCWEFATQSPCSG